MFQRSTRSRMIFKLHEESNCCCAFFIFKDIYTNIQNYKLKVKYFFHNFIWTYSTNDSRIDLFIVQLSLFWHKKAKHENCFAWLAWHTNIPHEHGCQHIIKFCHPQTELYSMRRFCQIYKKKQIDLVTWIHKRKIFSKL